MPELKDTVALMNSPNYKDRFVAEYLQTAIRAKGLQMMLARWDNNMLPFEPKSPRSLYNQQLNHMLGYIETLTQRAQIEDIALPDIE